MPYFKWIDKKMSLNFDPLDKEHKALFEIANLLYERHQAGAQKNEIAVLFQNLIALAVRHFRNEEVHMLSISSPGLAKHKENHTTLLTNLHEYYSAFESGDGRLTNRFFEFLNSWLTEHILGDDTQDAKHTPNGDQLEADPSSKTPIE